MQKLMDTQRSAGREKQPAKRTHRGDERETGRKSRLERCETVSVERCVSVWPIRSELTVIVD